MNKQKGMSFWRVAVTIGALIVVAAAIRDQLRLPADERTWHGSIWGMPYDFRIPTLEHLQETFWNENTSQILVPHAFGVGWSINFYPLVHPQAQ